MGEQDKTKTQRETKILHCFPFHVIYRHEVLTSHIGYVLKWTKNELPNYQSLGVNRDYSARVGHFIVYVRKHTDSATMGNLHFYYGGRMLCICCF